MKSASRRQAEDAFEQFYERKKDDDEEYELAVREEETHALIELHKMLVKKSGTHAELRELVENELNHRTVDDEDDLSLQGKMPPSQDNSEWDWERHAEFV